MANKTQPTGQPVDDFLASVSPERRCREGERLRAIFEDVTGESAVMWGPSIVGFGTRHYRYASGREGDWMRVGFSPRARQLSLYGLQDHPDSPAGLDRLGPHTTGAGCVYVRRLEEIDEQVLSELVALGYSLGDYDGQA